MFKKSFFGLALVAVLISGSAFAAAPKVGDKAPDFTLKGADGKDYKMSDFTKKGQIVVLEWFNKDCPYVRKFYDAKAMQDYQAKSTAQGVAWFTIASNAAGKEGHLDLAAAEKVQHERGIKSTALLMDSDGKVAKLYAAKTTPHMFVIDKKGLIAYQGAIDDRPSASAKTLAGAQNYVLAALASLEKNEPVKTASTAPYGCSVKY